MRNEDLMKLRLHSCVAQTGVNVVLVCVLQVSGLQAERILRMWREIPFTKSQGGVGGRRLDVVNVQGCRTGLGKDDLGEITFDIIYDTELTCSATADSVSLAYSAV